METHRGIYKIVIIFILAELFVPALSIQSRSVNLALETSFLFDPQDIKENATFINKVQTVLDKLKTVLEPNTAFRANKGNEKKVEKREEKVVLLKFLSQIGSALIKFDNADIKKFSSDLRDAVYKHAEKNKEFNELFEDKRLRAFIKNTVRIWADTDPMVLKVEIAKYITSVDTDAVIELFNTYSKVFDSSDEAKFKKLLKKFKNSIKQKDYTKFLTKTIDFAVFKRYKKLNFLLRHIVKDELRKFTEVVSQQYKNRIIDTDRRFSLSNIARVQKVPQDKDTSESDKDVVARGNTAKESFEKPSEIVIDKELNVDVGDDKDALSLKMH